MRQRIHIKHVLALKPKGCSCNNTDFFCLKKANTLNVELFFSSKLLFFEQESLKSYLDDLDSLLRFWNTDSYYTKPLLTLTGKSQLL